MSPFDRPLQYVAYDLVTGRYLGRVPLNGVTFGGQLLQPGTLSGTIDIASATVQNLAPLTQTAPGRTCLCVDYNGALVWSGMIWPRGYDFDNTSRKLTVTATELWSYPASRMQATDYSAPPYSGISGPNTTMAIWDATHTSVPDGGPGVYDPVLITWQLLSDALTQVPYGNILGGLSIAANGYTTPSAYLASGTQTPQANYLSVNYPYQSLQQLGSLISMIAGNGLGEGFDYAVDVAYSAGPGSVPVGTVNLSYPRRGRTYANNQLVLNCQQALKYSVPEDATGTGNTVYEQGSSGSLSVSQNTVPLQGGYPILEQLKSRANITSANMLSVLGMLGVADLAVGSYPVATPSVTTDLFAGPIPLGDFVIGDDCRWLIPATDGAGGVFDPRFPGGYDHEWRITGYQATVADDGQSTLQFNLALPPSYTISGPALP